MIRYVVGCLVVGLVLFLLFVSIISALIYFYGGDIANWFGNIFQNILEWLQNFLQTTQNQN